LPLFPFKGFDNAVQLSLYSYQVLGERASQLAVVKEHETFIKQMLNNVEGGFSIALDGCWGSGETIFVKQAQMLINALNDFSPAKIVLEERKAIVKSYRAIEVNGAITEKPQIAVYYDAWEHDNDDDPMVSILFDISQSRGLRLDTLKQRRYLNRFFGLATLNRTEKIRSW
jgi:hypothetical protein